MKTCFGVQMSPRAERIYSWINSRGIRLHTFSTDECVKGEMHRLVKALSELQGMIAGGKSAEGFTLAQLQAMERDLQAIMRRTPNERATDSNKRVVKEEQAKKEPARELETIIQKKINRFANLDID